MATNNFSFPSGAQAQSSHYFDGTEDDGFVIVTVRQAAPSWSGSEKAMAKQKTQTRNSHRDNKAALQGRFDCGYEPEVLNEDSSEWVEEVSFE